MTIMSLYMTITPLCNYYTTQRLICHYFELFLTLKITQKGGAYYAFVNNKLYSEKHIIVQRLI